MSRTKHLFFKSKKDRRLYTQLMVDPKTVGVDEKQDKRGKRPRSGGTSYAAQFREKQNVKRTYGVKEKQFRKIFKSASKSRGNTGTRLLQLLELRLDNVAYRLGLTNARPHARQLVAHGHVRVNGKKVDVASYTVKVGDVVSIKEKSHDFLAPIQEVLKNYDVPAWLERGKGFEGRVTQVPTREMIDEGIQEQLIVELYSR